MEDDRKLVERVLSGELEAFETLIERHKSLVVRIVARIVPIDDVTEVAHDTFVRAYEALGSYKLYGEFKRWLSRIAINTSYDFWRRLKKGRITPTEDSELYRLYEDFSEKKHTDLEGIRIGEELVQGTLQHLGVKDRLVFTLFYMDGYSLREVAEIAGMSVAQVKVRAFRGKRKLKKVLEKSSKGRL